jgi:phosphate uptake regulator
MRRKIIKQGAATLTLSLPAKWTKKLNLKAGDEIDVEEKDTTLVMTPPNIAKHTRETIDLSKLDTLLKRIVSAKYLEGVDELEVKFDSLNKARLIQQRVREMIGMEVIQQGKNHLVIKDISGITENAFDPILRRVFFMISAVADESLHTLKQKETDLAYLEDMEANINRVTDHCFRILNKYGYTEYSKTPVMYTIVMLLEQLGDEYKMFTNYITKNKVVPEPSIIALYDRIQRLFKKFEGLFYEFSYEGAASLAKERDSIVHEIDKKLNGTKSAKETYVLRSLREMTELIVRLMGQTLTLA